jgi:hypothetical protein
VGPKEAIFKHRNKLRKLTLAKVNSSTVYNTSLLICPERTSTSHFTASRGIGVSICSPPLGRCHQRCLGRRSLKTLSALRYLAASTPAPHCRSRCTRSTELIRRGRDETAFLILDSVNTAVGVFGDVSDLSVMTKRSVPKILAGHDRLKPKQTRRNSIEHGMPGHTPASIDESIRLLYSSTHLIALESDSCPSRTSTVSWITALSIKSGSNASQMLARVGRFQSSAT